jgi:purine-binding chemotaxis protein CheW
MHGHLEEEIEYVTAIVGGQLFGMPIDRVLDVFMPERITRVPLSPPEIAGVLNLRGRIVTAICLRNRLELPPRGTGESCMAMGIEYQGEAYGLIVDAAGEVLKLPASSRDAVPVNLAPSWSRVAAGVHRLKDRLLVVLEIDRIFDHRSESLAA